MTDLLTRLFIKNSKDYSNPAVRAAYGKLTGIVGIICNLILFAGKFTVGAISGSVSVSADAVNNLSDASSSIISLLGFKMASKPADDDHPYGHARYEYLSGLIVSILVLLIGIELLKSSVEKLLNPQPVEFSWITVVVLVASIAIKLWMAIFNRSIGKKINSNTLIATFADSRNDVISTSAVLIAALISHYTSLELDGWMGLLVAAFILYSGFGLVKETLDPLLGSAPSAELVEHIESKALSYEGVLGIHDLMVHDYGPGRQFASIHIEVDCNADVMEAHDMIDNIEKDFLSEGLHVTVHYDPVVTDDEELNSFKAWLRSSIKEIDEDLDIHDVRMVKGPTHTNVIFDCVVPGKLKMTQAELKAAVEALVAEKYPYLCVICFENAYAKVPKEKQ